MNDRDVIIGNLTTILMFVFSTIGGGAIINVLGGTSQASIIIGACVGLAYSIINAYFPNYLKIFNNDNRTDCSCEIPNEIVEFDGELDEDDSDEELVEEVLSDDSDEEVEGGC